jgi:hypothetical protein
MSKRDKWVYVAIAERLKAFGIKIEDQIAIDDTARAPRVLPAIRVSDGILGPSQEKVQKFSSLKVRNSTQAGIDFIAVDPKALMQAFRSARNGEGEVALFSMADDPDHWALKTSFAATFGTGFREVFQPTTFANRAEQAASQSTPLMSMSPRFGTPMYFTSLHAAVHESSGKCNIHIDDSGFVLDLPSGWSVTANLYDHIANELKWKDEFQKWLLGKTSNEDARKAIKEVIRRVSIIFPNIQNGMADLPRRLHSIRGPEVPLDVLTTALRIAAPVGVTVNIWDNDRFKVDAHGTLIDNTSAFTISFGGRW